MTTNPVTAAVRFVFVGMIVSLTMLSAARELLIGAAIGIAILMFLIVVERAS